MAVFRLLSVMSTRCPWVSSDPIYIDYHDKEWGRPVHDDRTLFEFLILEGAQAGLSWLTVLKKRENYRRRFYNFELTKVAGMTDTDLADALLDEGIIRNRLKVESTRRNARAALALIENTGSLDNYFWGWTKGKTVVSSPRPKSLQDYPATTALSDAISKDLKKQGFNFVGSTIIYAFLQATGIVDDHSQDCFLASAHSNSKENL